MEFGTRGQSTLELVSSHVALVFGRNHWLRLAIALERVGLGQEPGTL